jgi:hypothetical protein
VHTSRQHEPLASLDVSSCKNNKMSDDARSREFTVPPRFRVESFYGVKSSGTVEGMDDWSMQWRELI